MKKNSAKLGLSILAASALLIVGCKKPEPAVAPEPDTEVQTSLDAVWATYVVTDIEQICAFMGVDERYNHFYNFIPGTNVSATNGTVVVIRQPGQSPGDRQYMRMAFNDTRSVDGRFRQGSVFMDYSVDTRRKPDANLNSQNYDDYGFTGEVTLSNYRVDGWVVQLWVPPGKSVPDPAYLYNELTVTNNKWDPKTQNLTHKFAGKFQFIHPSDPNKNMLMDIEFVKTLRNTSDPAVYVKGKQPTPLTFSLAEVSYKGWARGVTDAKIELRPGTSNIYDVVDGTPFKIEFGYAEKGTSELVRDFRCFPDKVAGVATGSTATTVRERLEEHHPFVKGVASFTTGTTKLNGGQVNDFVRHSIDPLVGANNPNAKYPRMIYFGNEGNDLAYQCDNVGQIMIKGISYKVTFLK